MSIGNIKQRKLDPVTIKHAGDRIKDTADWMDRHAHVIMEEGVRAKFTQNYELVTAITLTGSRNFLECYQYDTYWGIDLSLSEATTRDDLSHIKSKNLMGDILATIRDNAKLIM
jgi:ribA/ribD-fused uncharacterized protein